jgi:anthranilate synthase/aminodeoxychorismate synthase-like glutamine amidotransferase
MILILDNYDSFTYNLAQLMGSMGLDVMVRRNDQISIDEISSLSPRAIVISPGPGRPRGAGISLQVVENFSGVIPILGVCLGHQCIAEALGAKVVKASRPFHGKTSDIYHDGRTLYTGLRNPFCAARYHSLMVLEDSVEAPLEVSSYTPEGEVMGIRSVELKVEGVQFHPESIATPLGKRLIENFLESYQ